MVVVTGVTCINVPLRLEVWQEVRRTGEGKGTTMELKRIFYQLLNEEGDAYLGEGVDREWKWRRGSSICTEVKWSRNPKQFSSLTDMFNMRRMIPWEEASGEGEWEGEPRRWMRSNTSRSEGNSGSLMILLMIVIIGDDRGIWDN